MRLFRICAREMLLLTQDGVVEGDTILVQECLVHLWVKGLGLGFRCRVTCLSRNARSTSHPSILSLLTHLNLTLNLNLTLCTVLYPSPHQARRPRQLLAILLFEKENVLLFEKSAAWRARNATGARALVRASFTGGDVEEWVADAEELLGWHACENCRF